jgi:hypothetical protein
MPTIAEATIASSHPENMVIVAAHGALIASEFPSRGRHPSKPPASVEDASIPPCKFPMSQVTVPHLPKEQEAYGVAEFQRGRALLDQPMCDLVLSFTPCSGVLRPRVRPPRSAALWIDIANSSR